MKLNLRYSDVIQGPFIPGNLNLMMVFQVNCPGCFMYGFPQMIELHTKYHDKISFVALSTAFEDFNVNTVENTRLLIEANMLVGETKKAYDANLLKWTNNAILFPVLMDSLTENKELVSPEFINDVVFNQPEWHQSKALEAEKIKSALTDYFTQLPSSGFTFTANLMQGTPTFVLFNNAMEIHEHWFGHVPHEAVEEKIKLYI